MAADRIDEIAALLKQASDAHHQYEVNRLKGQFDQAWPRWYAGYAVEQGISALLGHAVIVEALAQFLAASNAEFEAAQPGEPWEDYTARAIARKFV
jgi:hypothetical protein